MLGENLLGQWTSGTDAEGNLLNDTASAFSDWWRRRPPGRPGDAIGDGQVDINDLTIVLSNFGKTGMTWAKAKFTGSGTVDINDLTIVLSNFGASFPP